MLVLSRKTQETIVLPSLGISVQVVDIKRGVVRLGIDAPREVTVLRGELAAGMAARGRTQPGEAAARGSDRADLVGRLRDQLTTTGIGLGVLSLQLDAGLSAEARRTVAAIQADFQVLLHGMAGEVQADPAPSGGPKTRRQRALLVEDDGNQRELLAGFLRQSGLDVDTAGDGADALDYLRTRGTPDLVLLDMGLPRVDGPTTVREIRRDPAFAGLKIFGVTGRLPNEFDLSQGPGGVNGWFHKPLDPVAMLQNLTAEIGAPLFTA